MSKGFRVFFAILTLALTLAVLALTVWSVTQAFWGLAVVGAVLTVMFGVFVYHDYTFLFPGKVNNETPNTK